MQIMAKFLLLISVVYLSGCATILTKSEAYPSMYKGQTDSI
jgi:uncharacterized protein YceK